MRFLPSRPIFTVFPKRLLIFEPPRRTMPRHSPPTRALRVLVVDDDATLRMVLTRLLKDRGHEVHAAGDAPSALEILERTAVDAALVDVEMPGRGTTVAARLTSDPGFRGPLFMMTGDRGREDEVPAAEWLRKPFRCGEVVARVEACSAAG